MLIAVCSLKKTGAALIQHRHSSIGMDDPQGNPLRNEKDFVRIRIFYFRSRRKSFYIDVLAG